MVINQLFSVQHDFNLENIEPTVSFSCCQMWTRVLKFPAKSKRGSEDMSIVQIKIPANFRQRSKKRFAAMKLRGYRGSHKFCSSLPKHWFLAFSLCFNVTKVGCKGVFFSPILCLLETMFSYISYSRQQRWKLNSLRFQLISFCLHWWLLKKPFLYFQSGVCCWTT